MKEIYIESLPKKVWFWRKGSQHRWILAERGVARKLDVACSYEAMPDPREIVLIDPNWCHVCYQKMPWPPGVICTACGDDANDRKTLEDLKCEIGRWVGIAPELVHI